MYTAPVPVDQLAGSMVKHYQIEQLLGRGDVSIVYLASQQPQQQPVMLTLFRLPLMYDEQACERFVSRFSQIVSRLMQLRHPSLFPIYDHGTESGCPYLVTPFIEAPSLATLLQQRGRCTPAQILPLVKQIAAGLDYVHMHGLAHGSLRSANVLLTGQQSVCMTGLGLAQMLAMHGIGGSGHAYKHLLNVAGTFLYSPGYIAPEVVRGAPVSAVSDVYSLGMVIYELLAGSLPFTGSEPFTVATMHVNAQIPSLQERCAEISAMLDLVVQRALARDPAARYQSAGQLAGAFERVVSLLAVEVPAHPLLTRAAPQDLPSIVGDTLPPDSEWSQEPTTANLPGYLSSADTDTSTAMPAVKPAVSPSAPAQGDDNSDGGSRTGRWQIMPPVITDRLTAVRANTGAARSVQAPTGSLQRSTTHVPFAGGDEPEPASRMEARENEMFAAQSSAEMASPSAPDPIVLAKGKKRSRKPRLGRRSVLVASAGVVAASVVLGGGLGLAFLAGRKNPLSNSPTGPASVAQNAATAPPGTVMQNTPTPASQGNKQNTPAPAPTTGNNGTNKNPQKTPTAVVRPKGKVIGSQNLAVNSAQKFTNPADGNASLLIHLPNGNFAAYESTCTHEDVQVNYNPTTHMLVCPRHGAIFDPARNGAVVKGPARRKLPTVTIYVNADGTISAG